MPIQYFKKIPITTAQMMEWPNIAPVRVARIISPEPMYSAHQTKDGPTRAKIARPFGGDSILILAPYINSRGVVPEEHQHVVFHPLQTRYLIRTTQSLSSS